MMRLTSDATKGGRPARGLDGCLEEVGSSASASGAADPSPMRRLFAQCPISGGNLGLDDSIPLGLQIHVLSEVATPPWDGHAAAV